LLGLGIITLRAEQRENHLVLSIEDNAGLYRLTPGNTGLGMNLVDKRIRIRYGDDYGVSVEFEPERFTRIILNLPLEDNALC